MKKIILLFSAVALLASCNKPKEMDMTLTTVNNGSLNVKVVDNANAPIADLTVRLYDGATVILEGKTNASGDISFNKVLEGNYTVYIKEVTISGKKYTVSQLVQIISGDTKSLTIKPQEYTGTLTMTFNSTTGGNDTIVANTMVVIFRAADYDDLFNPEFSDIQAIGIDSAKTDAAGKVSFTVPANVAINYMIYTSSTKYDDNTTSRYADKGDEEKLNLFVNWTALF